MDDPFFRHFIVGAMLFIGLISVFLAGLIVLSLWEAGFEIFVTVIGTTFGFCWIVHKLASSKVAKDWFNNL